MSSYYNCHDILYAINFSVPSRSLRHKPVFKPNISKLKIHSSSFSQRTMTFLNELFLSMICNCSYSVFRNLLQNKLYSISKSFEFYIIFILRYVFMLVLYLYLYIFLGGGCNWAEARFSSDK